MWRFIFLLLFPLTLSGQLKRFQFSQNKMGSPFIVIFYCSDSAKATELSSQCFALVDSLNNIFSDYSPSSEVGKLASLQIIKEQNVSRELFQMILRSKQAWAESGETFDVTVGALTQLWRKANIEKRFPSHNEVMQAKQLTGLGNLFINEKANTISFKKQGMRFDFGGIVPGYAAQKVVDFLRSKNISIALADASGDIVMSEAPPGKSGWTVGINLPESENELWDKKLELKNCAVSTSGDVYRYTIHNGKKYSHIIDPRDGYGVTSQRNVTVIAKEGAVADWLATACSILPIDEALRLAKKENAALFIATLKNDKVVTYKTENFDGFFREE
jgi:thiamine biosynthesis lipoprotein